MSGFSVLLASSGSDSISNNPAFFIPYPNRIRGLLSLNKPEIVGTAINMEKGIEILPKKNLVFLTLI